MAKTLHFQKIIWAGWVLMTIGTGLNALLKPHSSGGILYGIRIIMPMGAGLLFTTSVVAVQSVQKGEDVGIATSVQVFSRSLGQTFGVALGAVIFQNEFDRRTSQAIAAGGLLGSNPEMWIHGSQADAAFELIKSFPESVQEIYRYVYADSLRTIWYVLTGISGFAFLVSLAMRDESLNKEAKGRHQFDHERGRGGDVEQVKEDNENEKDSSASSSACQD